MKHSAGLNSKRRLLALLLPTLFLLAQIVGCANTPAASHGDTSNAVTPGIIERPDGSIEATGILLQIDDGEGTCWALTGESPEPSSSRLPPIIAYVVNPDMLETQEHNGQTVSIVGTLDDSTPIRDWAPNIRGTELSVLDSFGGLGEYQVPEPTSRSVPGIYALQDGRTQIVGEVTFFDTPDRRVWALRYPATDSRQASVHYVAAIANPDDVGLQDRSDIVVINGMVTEPLPGFPGLTVISAEEIVTTH